MVSRFLDPDNLAGAIADNQPVGELPTNVRNFGHAPCITDLRPGDIILTAKRSPTMQCLAISRYQAQLFSIEDSLWTHAAIHVDRGVLVEAVRGGVRIGHVYDLIPHYKVRVRRTPKLQDNKRLRIAVNACMQIGKRYETEAVKQFVQSYFSHWYNKGYIGRQRNICSQLCLNAYLYGAELNLTAIRNDGHATPAHLADCGDLTDIELRWVKLERT